MISTRTAEAKSLLADLREQLGTEKVSDEAGVLQEYSDDLTEIPGHLPDVVVKPKSAQDIQVILRIANKNRIPVIPRVANTNVGGLAIPEQGGIVVDLTEMNRIIETNEADKYAIIEPGVTWSDMKAHLTQNHPRLRFGYSLGPPYSSVVANCLMDGLTNLGLKHGTTAHWINGLEAVLPTGEIVRTGIGAVSRYWCSRSPLPDLTGLFVNFYGTTGIVTKLSVALWPRHPYHKRFFVLAYDTHGLYDFIDVLVRAEICDDIAGLSWPVGKMLFGDKNPLYKDPSEPEHFLYIDVSAEFEDLLHAKLVVLNRLVKEHQKQGVRLDSPLEVQKLVKVAPRFQKFAEFPTELDFLLELGGLTWIGTYGPTSQWQEGVNRGMHLMEEHGFPPVVVTRPMQVGHFGVLRFIGIFDKSDKDQVARVTKLNEALSDMVIELGYFPYKTPPWVVRRHRDKIDPEYLALLRRIRGSIDPEGIMNPGKWPV